MTNELSTIIANVGFPIAISMYLLVRIEGKLQILSDSITELSKTLVDFYFTLSKCISTSSELSLILYFSFLV